MWLASNTLIQSRILGGVKVDRNRVERGAVVPETGRSDTIKEGN